MPPQRYSVEWWQSHIRSSPDNPLPDHLINALASKTAMTTIPVNLGGSNGMLTSFIDAWIMFQKEQSPIRGSIIANDCGTGKTFTFLLLQVMYYIAKLKLHQQGVPKGESLDARPMLIICPAPLVYQTCQEMANNFGGLLNPRVYYGTNDSAPEGLREYTLTKDQWEKELKDRSANTHTQSRDRRNVCTTKEQDGGQLYQISGTLFKAKNPLCDDFSLPATVTESAPKEKHMHRWWKATALTDQPIRSKHCCGPFAQSEYPTLTLIALHLLQPSSPRAILLRPLLDISHAAFIPLLVKPFKSRLPTDHYLLEPCLPSY